MDETNTFRTDLLGVILHIRLLFLLGLMISTELLLRQPEKHTALVNPSLDWHIYCFKTNTYKLRKQLFL